MEGNTLKIEEEKTEEEKIEIAEKDLVLAWLKRHPEVDSNLSREELLKMIRAQKEKTISEISLTQPPEEEELN